MSEQSEREKVEEIIAQLRCRTTWSPGTHSPKDQLCTRAADLIDSLTTQLSQALRELEAARSHSSALLRDVEHAEAQRDQALRELGEARTRADELQADLNAEIVAHVAMARSTAELRGALEVFGAVADAYARAHEQHVRNYADEGRTGAGPLSDGHRVSVALGDCRKARTALASSMKETR